MKTKKPLFALSVILMLTLTISMLGIQSANAAVIQITYETYAYVILAPTTVGVNQDMLITYRIDKVAFGALIRSGHFNGTSITITKPDGKTEIKRNLEMDSTSAGWFSYRPTQIGSYIFVMDFPAHWINTTTGGTTTARLYQASTSAQTVLTVQEAPLEPIPINPLPTGYWTRPIYAENKGWWQIADNWLMLSYDINSRPFYWGTAFAPYTSAPNSAHVLWKEPIWFGGMVGGKFGDKVYYTGLSYEQFYNPLILNGRIIYTEHGPTGAAAFGTRILDLYTGAEIMYLNNTVISFAQTAEIETGNEHGLLPYLWSVSGQNWLMFDAFTGRQILNLTGMPTGGNLRFGPKGEILVYVLSTTQNTLTMWNSTRAVAGQVFDTWSPAYGSIVNASRPTGGNDTSGLQSQSHSPFMGVEWNVTIPDVPGAQSIAAVGDGYLLAEYRDTSGFPYIYEDMAYNIAAIKRDSNGVYPTQISHAWIQNRTNIYSAFYRAPWSIDNGVYALQDEGKMQVHGYSIKTGEELWATEPLTSGLGIFTYQVHLAYGRLYTVGFDGYVRSYNSSNGQLAWEYYFGNAGYETPYGTWPVYNGFTIADHKIYVANDEHSPDQVMWRGGKLTCINADTGKGLWNISGWMRMPVIADGYLTSLNVLDGQVYTIGKGTSKTTVNAPLTAITAGHSFMITGTVTDQSPGQKDTPAISDESMASWMEYIHMQKLVPKNATGVKVTLMAYDPNGNVQTIGTVTTDTSSLFKKSWIPTIPGEYTIIASFDGTNSYGGSFAETAIVVEEAPSASPTAPPTPTPTGTPTVAPTATASPSPAVINPEAGSNTAMYIGVAAVVIIAAVVAVAVFLRKRK